jgi:hypothetical protein
LQQVGGFRVAGRDDPRHELQHTERLADFVADQHRKTFQLLGLPFNGGRVLGDEGIHGLLLQNANAFRDATDDLERLHGVDLRAHLLDFARHEAFEHDAEQVILAQQLMNRGPLLIAQLAELGGFAHHHRVGGNRLVVGPADVVRDLRNQLRNVVEQLSTGKHVLGGDRQDRAQIVEPLLGEDALRAAQFRGQRIRCRICERA